MPEFKSIEELIIDDSFANYCFIRDEEDYSYWENFMEEHPEYKDEIDEARKIVLSLHAALKEKSEEGEKNEKRGKIYHLSGSAKQGREGIRWFRYVAAASVIIAIFLGGRYFFEQSSDSIESPSVSVSTTEKGMVYTTRKGERKMITLFDSTKIWLNADSELRIDENYGRKDRKVHLTGEALFDVVHNDRLPFVVYTANYQVTDLGTVFNVKAYPEDESSEASLIHGRIEVKLSENNETISLEPDQKIIINNKSGLAENNYPSKDNSGKVSLVTESNIKIAPLTYSISDSTLLETSWVDRLEINNESLYEMQDKMERWFGVDIAIEDSGVGKYSFTATFKKENINEALEALRYAYPFNFKIEKNEVTITK